MPKCYLKGLRLQVQIRTIKYDAGNITGGFTYFLRYIHKMLGDEKHEVE